MQSCKDIEPIIYYWKLMHEYKNTALKKYAAKTVFYLFYFTA